MSSVTDRESVAAITGGASGIGLATARRLIAAGARVALLDIDVTRCRQAAEALGGSAAPFECDVSMRQV